MTMTFEEHERRNFGKVPKKSTWRRSGLRAWGVSLHFLQKHPTEEKKPEFGPLYGSTRGRRPSRQGLPERGTRCGGNPAGKNGAAAGT